VLKRVPADMRMLELGDVQMGGHQSALAKGSWAAKQIVVTLEKMADTSFQQPVLMIRSVSGYQKKRLEGCVKSSSDYKPGRLSRSPAASLMGGKWIQALKRQFY
jgi:hypothetical protein